MRELDLFTPQQAQSIDAILTGTGRRAADAAAVLLIEAAQQTCAETLTAPVGAAASTGSVLSRVLAFTLRSDTQVQLAAADGTPRWQIETTSSGAVRIERSAHAPAVIGLNAAVLQATSDLAIWLLDADPQRWMKQLPCPRAHAWQRRLEDEAIAAEHLLWQWLHLDSLPEDGRSAAAWWEHLGYSNDLDLLRQTWIDWLLNTGALVLDADRLRPGTRQAAFSQVSDPAVVSLTCSFEAHRDLITQILTGQASGLALLEVPELRPTSIAVADPPLKPVWDDLAVMVQHTASQAPEATVTVADVGGVLTDNQHLREQLLQAGAHIVAVPAGRPAQENVDADIAVAVQTLHRWADPAQAARAVARSIKPAGHLLAVETTTTGALGLLVAGMIEGGFIDAHGTRRDTPAHDRRTWLEELEHAGMKCTWAETGSNPTVVITALSEQQLPAAASPQAIAPSTPTQIELAQIWAELLKTPPTSIEDSFFELGGDSLLATRLVSTVRHRFNITLPMRELFADPRLAGVAQRIDEHATNGLDADMAIDEGVL
ncbi:Linear gramicidin synthase subunit D [Dermatophilus congolensis]|uniref:Linear gramicidin synthase subunit D n=1 Tax=Dermatophilus congolensis TaxID=1863 RepID=A0A239VKN6_9MICO|nr:phosphopantetheine-binding protein [Dermatophilus congolensis]SNV22632.1 Linear gramicidin synthase subunit D [Dermatophilus congolensis]